MRIFSNGKDIILEQDKPDYGGHMVTEYVNLSEHFRAIVREELEKGVALKSAEPAQVIGAPK